MSADNWAVCPKCRAAGKVLTNEEYVAKAMEQYGKVPYEHFTKLLEAAKEKHPEANMREDYHIGVDWDGQFEVSYKASCGVCKFSFSFSYKADATKGVKK